MAHIVISYDDIERIYGATFSGRPITNIKKHPWMARCLMVEFPGDPEDEEEGEEQDMWKEYQKTALQEMRPYVPGETLSGISISLEDTPELGGMIARNADNHEDQWYVAKDFFEKNYSLARESNDEIFHQHIKSHIENGEDVICKICGLTYNEIIGEDDGRRQ